MQTNVMRIRGVGKKLIDWRILYLLAFITMAMITLIDYLPWTSPAFLLGLVAVIATIQKTASRYKTRFAIVALILLVITFLVPVKTLFLFALAFSVFYFIETSNYSLNFLSVVAVFISSPVFEYLANVFSFPIRLKLADITGGLFSLFNTDVTVKGNVILHSGREFSIDPACMGLSMLSISMLSGIILIGLFQKKKEKILSWQMTIIYLFALLFLNIVANLFRMVILVQLIIMPGSSMHDLTGLACLLLYVCLPAIYLARLLVTRYGRERARVEDRHTKPSLIVLSLLLLGLAIISFRIHTVDTYRRFTALEKRRFDNYQCSQYAPGILKLEKPGSLVYVKFIRGFYDTDHNPTICWKGSGYEFKEIKTQRIGAKEIYTASLVNGRAILYTAWWYGNDKNVTTSQWTWRWDMLKGANNYAVVNVTVANQASLYTEVEKIIQKQKFVSLFKNRFN